MSRPEIAFQGNPGLPEKIVIIPEAAAEIHDFGSGQVEAERQRLFEPIPLLPKAAPAEGADVIAQIPIPTRVPFDHSGRDVLGDVAHRPFLLRGESVPLRRFYFGQHFSQDVLVQADLLPPGNVQDRLVKIQAVPFGGTPQQRFIGRMESGVTEQDVLAAEVQALALGQDVIAKQAGNA